MLHTNQAQRYTDIYTQQHQQHIFNIVMMRREHTRFIGVELPQFDTHRSFPIDRDGRDISAMMLSTSAVAELCFFLLLFV